MRRPLYVPLTWEEFAKLREAALVDCRDPRDQARYMLRAALGLTDQPKHNGAGTIRQDETRAVAA